MSNKYIFTLRNTIKSEPRITQEKILVNYHDYKLISSLDFLFSAEKDKGKKASKEKMQFYKSEMNALSLGDFSQGMNLHYNEFYTFG